MFLDRAPDFWVFRVIGNLNPIDVEHILEAVRAEGHGVFLNASGLNGLKLTGYKKTSALSSLKYWSLVAGVELEKIALEMNGVVPRE